MLLRSCWVGRDTFALLLRPACALALFLSGVPIDARCCYVSLSPHTTFRVKALTALTVNATSTWPCIDKHQLTEVLSDHSSHACLCLLTSVAPSTTVCVRATSFVFVFVFVLVLVSALVLVLVLVLFVGVGVGVVVGRAAMSVRFVRSRCRPFRSIGRMP